MPVDLLLNLPKPDRELALRLGFLDSWLNHPDTFDQVPGVLRSYRRYCRTKSSQELLARWLNNEMWSWTALDFWSTFPLTDIGEWASKHSKWVGDPPCCRMPIQCFKPDGRMKFKGAAEQMAYAKCNRVLADRRQRFKEAFERIHPPQPIRIEKLAKRRVKQQENLSPFKKALVNLQKLPHEYKCKALRMGFSRSWLNHPEHVEWVRGAVHASMQCAPGSWQSERAARWRADGMPEIEYWDRVTGGMPMISDQVDW